MRVNVMSVFARHCPERAKRVEGQIRRGKDLSNPRIFLITAIFSLIIHSCKYREVFPRLIREGPHFSYFSFCGKNYMVSYRKIKGLRRRAESSSQSFSQILVSHQNYLPALCNWLGQQKLRLFEPNLTLGRLLSYRKISYEL